jgi:DNA-binding NtrC family response regulator
MKSVLVVSKEPEVITSIRKCFRSRCKTDHEHSRENALGLLRKRRYDLVFIDLELLGNTPGKSDCKESLQDFFVIYPTLEIIILAHRERVREAVHAVKAGASDFLTYPIVTEEVKYITDALKESRILQSELEVLRDQFWEADFQDVVQTRNNEMKKVYDKIRSVAPTKSTVLLTGETGTGKGFMANLIHCHSNRRAAQFIPIHCGAIPDTLLESELFGHEKGAFTGALRRKLGKFEIAGGGTIFLDEIGTITPSAQIKLLQVLQDGTFQRVGGEETLASDARVISATNMDLKGMCNEGLFRKDLFYRLNVFPIEIPPLKERYEDIPHLVEVILEKMNRITTKTIRGVDPLVKQAFLSYPWPGNIRELENLIERACILEASSILRPDSFPMELFDSIEIRDPESPDASRTLFEIRQKGIEKIEESYLRENLARFDGRIKDTAQAAGITTRQLHKLMKKYGLRKESFKSNPR